MLMKIFKNTRAIVTHPVGLFAIGLVLGLIAAYLWINYTTVANPFCNV